MTRRIFKSVKPLALALLLLALAPCVLEFALRVSACRMELITSQKACGVSIVSSWQTHHQLEPLQRSELTCPTGLTEDPSLPEPADKDVDIILPAEFDRLDPLQPGTIPAGHVTPATAEVTADRILFRTNSLGLRGSEIAVPKPPGVYRIICLGDETVLAPEVTEEATFCRMLEKRLQPYCSLRVEVINAGVPEFCPLLSCLQTRHQLIGLSPDLVIACFDMSDVWEDRRFRRLTELGDGEQPLACTSPDLLSAPKTRPLSDHFLAWQWTQQKLTKVFRRQAREVAGSIDSPRTMYEWLADETGEWTLQASLTLSAYDHLAKLVNGMNSRLMLAVHPAPWQVSPTASSGARRPLRNGVYEGTLFDNRKPFQLVHEFAVSRGLPLCDISSLFLKSAQPDDLYQSQTRGLSDAGHHIFAELLTTTILRELDGPWRPVSTPRPSQTQADSTGIFPASPTAPLRRASANGTDLVPLPGQR